MSRPKPETAFIQRVRDYLHARGAVTIRVNSGLTVLGSEQEGNRRVIRGAEAGTADIVGCYQGSFFAIECKVGKNRPTQAQLDFIRRVLDAGGLGFVAWSLDDVDKNFEW